MSWSVTGQCAESAYLDIEFGYVYGTCRGVMMPVEIGVVIHRPEDDSVRYLGEQFRYDVDVEIWKKVTDPCGKTIGVATTVANMSRDEYGMAYDHSFRVPENEVLTAREIARRAFADLRVFMESLLSTADIGEVVVFAAHMERMAFRAAGVSLDGCSLVDLQREIRRRLGMKQVLSLSRLARLIDFSAGGSTVASRHFRYPVSLEYRHFLDVHRGMGDAVRTFLLAREFQERFPDLEARVRALVDSCKNGG
ncbi:MAG TPA: hypothetical protein PKK74_06715 [Candidatus Methanoculleus thermohydrogenotrophicum]|nr:hypothetical protein [Candidatus Methanoculleus thermohydrogenotrophicum]HOB18368.1 hypothetical protein [Candidatus Methanoculleus thermohydrogenotrophicum]HPZ38467.1 hypothetical protein [Candidatus Methanoculleus thermohydrogenotrophicum]HQC91414.1 hypothetical protein [Candidatus Methanoculleus thermohydrogenotrophicum]